MGLTEADWSRPIIGIATTWTGTMPCNLGQRDLAQHVAAGVRAAGGTPLEFNTIAVSDNLTMGTDGMRAPLISREVIADSIELVERDVRPRSLVTREALENAIVGVAGTGGSTNGVLHLLAFAEEAGVALTLDDFDRLSRSTPVVASLTPGGKYVAGDLHRVGGSAAVI